MSFCVSIAWRLQSAIYRELCLTSIFDRKIYWLHGVSISIIKALRVQNVSCGPEGAGAISHPTHDQIAGAVCRQRRIFICSSAKNRLKLQGKLLQNSSKLRDLVNAFIIFDFWWRWIRIQNHTKTWWNSNCADLPILQLFIIKYIKCVMHNIMRNIFWIYVPNLLVIDCLARGVTSAHAHMCALLLVHVCACILYYFHFLSPHFTHTHMSHTPTLSTDTTSHTTSPSNHTNVRPHPHPTVCVCT